MYVRSRWFCCSLRLGMPLNSPARRPSSSVFRSLMSNNCSAPGRMLDTLLPIPNAEYPAFYPIGIKASCVCWKLCRHAAPCGSRRWRCEYGQTICTLFLTVISTLASRRAGMSTQTSRPPTTARDPYTSAQLSRASFAGWPVTSRLLQ